jgi:hypothetical protein
LARRKAVVNEQRMGVSEIIVVRVTCSTYGRGGKRLASGNA